VHFQIWSFTYIAGYLSCRMTDIEGFLTIYGHSDNLLNNNVYLLGVVSLSLWHHLGAKLTTYQGLEIQGSK